MSVLTIARTSLRRYLRDRTAMFFVVALPVVVIVIVGATATGFDRFRVGIVTDDDGPLAVELVAALDRSPALELRSFDALDDAVVATRRGEVTVTIVVPAGFDEALRTGDAQAVRVLADQRDTSQQAVTAAIASVVADLAARVQAAQFASAVVGRPFDDGLRAADAARGTTAPITIDTRTVGTEARFLPEGFSYSAPTMLVLFVFVNALAGGAALIENRRLGMYERMAAAPVTARSIIAGETLCYFGMAVLQSVLIVSVGAVVFGVDWGDPLAAALLVAVWALVGTGAGMLSGTLFATPEQASSIGPSVGIAFGMLGGCMWPLEIVPEAMQTVGHVVPHGWAVDSWTTLLSRGGDVTDIAGALGVLLAFAAGLLAISVARLHRMVTA